MRHIMIAVAIIGLCVSPTLAAPLSLHHYYATHHAMAGATSKRGH
jgi:hypothetical protein